MIKENKSLDAAKRQALTTYCTGLLKDFCIANTGVQSSTVATYDGVTVASTLHGKHASDKLSAMSSAISALAAAMTREVGHPEPDRVLLESEHGRIIFIKVPAAGTGIVFTAVTDHNALLGTLLWNCRSTTEKLALYTNRLLD